MKGKASISHDKVMVKKLRQRPRFAAEYLKAAIEDTDEPEVFLIALRHIADAARNFDHLFTPQVVSELEQISAAAKAGGKTFTSEEVREHFRKKSDARRAKHPE